jgi:hypothetical protein
MKTKDLLTIGTTALGTAALTVVFLASPRMTGSDANPTGATIAQPKLAANGIEITLSPANGREFKAGEQPEFELRAVNTLNEPSSAAICATLYSERPDSRASRIISMPAVLWQQELEFALKPNESKALTLETRTNLPANSSFYVLLSKVARTAGTADNPGNVTVAQFGPRGADGIVALRFSTVPPAAALARPVAANGSAAAVATR